MEMVSEWSRMASRGYDNDTSHTPFTLDITYITCKMVVQELTADVMSWFVEYNIQKLVAFTTKTGRERRLFLHATKIEYSTIFSNRNASRGSCDLLPPLEVCTYNT